MRSLEGISDVGGRWLGEVGWLVGGGFKGSASQAALGLTPLQLSREQLK